ncbi:MAG: hypothetical protein ACM359_07975 [Bacillota bacterium]
MPDIRQQIQQLGNEIVDGFKAKIGELKLTTDELALIQRVAQRLAYVAMYLPGADEVTKGVLAMQRDAALATLQNMTVAKAVEAERMMREAIGEAVAKALQMGLGLALKVIAA